MNEAFHLSRLQKIDTQLDQATNRIAEIQRILAQDESINAAEASLKQRTQVLEHARLKLKKIEDTVNAQRVKIELNESALYGGKVKNPKELQDLQNEVASLKKYMLVLEDQQLEAMMELETTENDHQASTGNLLKTQADFTTRSAALLGEQSRLQKEVDRLTAERAPVITQLPAPILETYDRLRKQKRGVAVAGAADESCTVCGAELTPGAWQAARSPHQITYCNSCGRILYAG